MEHSLKDRPDLVIELGVSETMANALCSCDYQLDNHIRLMRFDFHPTKEKGFLISEVNSDVPAGYPEASVLPGLAKKYFKGYTQHGNLGEVLVNKLQKLAPPESKIAYLHDTHTVEDYQLLHFIGDLLQQRGFRSLYADPSFITWESNKAVDLGAILRYYPVEWLEFHEKADWREFIKSETPSCNHPIALLTQSKRLPLVWDKLGIDLPHWKKLLPKTVCASEMPLKNGWIYKPAFGRVGEGINIPGTVSDAENLDIKSTAQSCPTQWVAQEMFNSIAFDGLHLSFGVFVVDGEFAGLFSRASKLPRIDSEASEIPVLVKERNGQLV
jgi:glutathionylspermidine synthase